MPRSFFGYFYHSVMWFDWLLDLMTYWFFGRLIDWLIDWLIGWLFDGLVDWLIDWLIDLTCQIWRRMMSVFAGDSMVWKPSPSTNLCGIAIQKVIETVLQRNNLPPALCTLCCGGAGIGVAMSKDDRLPLVSFTGSTQIGLKVAAEVQARFGRPLLELGGNNAVIVAEDADLSLVIPSVVFGSVGHGRSTVFIIFFSNMLFFHLASIL